MASWSRAERTVRAYSGSHITAEPGLWRWAMRVCRVGRLRRHSSAASVRCLEVSMRRSVLPNGQVPSNPGNRGELPPDLELR